LYGISPPVPPVPGRRAYRKIYGRLYVLRLCIVEVTFDRQRPTLVA
jgi:hypothetical protein